MIDGALKCFVELHKEHLKEIFYPIKQLLNKCKNQNRDLYSFFSKHNILVKYSNQLAKISNFKNQFNFIIDDYKDIKKIKLYYDKYRYKEFWTCGTIFTKFYFENYLKNRICIKSENSYESINLDNDENLNHNEYYLLSNKEFDFKKNIKSFVELNWENPPEELNYIIKKGKYNKNYKMQKIDFENENLKTFFHNSKIGITVSILTRLISYYELGWRILYIDCNYILNSNTKNKKKYYLFFLNLLFSKGEAEGANEFLTNIYYNFAKYDKDFETLLNEIIKKFNKNKQILIIFDNIKNKQHYSLVEDTRDKIDIVKNNHIFIREFIEINENTLSIIKRFFENEKAVKMVGKNENLYLKNDLKIIVGLMESKKNFLSNYNNFINDKLSEIFKDYSLSKYINLIKLFYFLYAKDISKETSNDIIFSNILKDFIDFLYIKIVDGLVELNFRNRIIENFFQNYYILYHNIFCMQQSKSFLKELLESEKAYNFERQIIFSIILGNLTSVYHRINIDRIYCAGKFPKFNFDKNILFYQNNCNSPLYDFGVLFKNEEGKPILKIFQVFINKSVENVEKLESEKIQFDLSYFIEKINRIFKIKIEHFSFGIIFSKNRYDKYKENNYIKFLKKYCLDNKYEFLLYDFENNKFYIDKSEIQDEDHFSEIKSFEGINSYFFKPIKIFRDKSQICKKYYIEKIKISHYITELKKINKYFDSKINLKLVGKFKCHISVFEQNKNDNIIFYYSRKNNKNISIFYQNYDLYTKKKTNLLKLSLENAKKEVLIFINENSTPLKLKKNLNLKIQNSDIQVKYLESDTNYLISEMEEDILNLSSEEESEYDKNEEFDSEINEIRITDLIDKQNFQSKTIEYKLKEDSNKINDLIVKDNNDNKEKTNVSKEKNEENNSDSFKVQNEDIEISDDSNLKEQNESSDNIIEFESKDLKAYQIDKNIYEALLNGNETVLQNLKEKISNVKTEDGNFLGKRRNRSYPLSIIN